MEESCCGRCESPARFRSWPLVARPPAPLLVGGLVLQELFVHGVFLSSNRRPRHKGLRRPRFVALFPHEQRAQVTQVS